MTADNIHIGIDWLESVAFEHTKSIGKNVLIIGVGNTAMDCCRTSLRLGAKNVNVMARKPRAFFKASEWELEDAEEENIDILTNHSPKSFVVKDGKLTGMVFELMEYEVDDKGKITSQKITGETTIACATMSFLPLVKTMLSRGLKKTQALNLIGGLCLWLTKPHSSRPKKVYSLAVTLPLAR